MFRYLYSWTSWIARTNFIPIDSHTKLNHGQMSWSQGRSWYLKFRLGRSSLNFRIYFSGRVALVRARDRNVRFCEISNRPSPLDALALKKLS